MPRKLHNSLLALSIVGLLLAGGFLISRPVATAPMPAFAAASAVAAAWRSSSASRSCWSR